MCGLRPCDPMTEACTWSAAYREACEARALSAWPLERRRAYLKALPVERRAGLEKILMRLWIERKGRW